MIDIRNIVCPIDFSDFSRRALDYAIAIARRYESTITVIHVSSPITSFAQAGDIPPVPPLVLTHDERERVRLDLLRFAEAESTEGIRIDAVVCGGDTVREILSEAAARKADLLTLGTHGRSGFERLFLGSVTEKLLRKATCPVLTVPRRHPDAVPATPVVFKRILCPVDFSDCSMSALNYAMSLAEEVDGELTVLYVVANDFVHLPGESPSDSLDKTISVADYFIRREENIRRLLKEAVPDTVATYCKVERLMTHGKPSAEILRLSEELKSDLVVIGVRGRGTTDLAVFGSTTQQVVRQASCPVLTIRGN